MSLEEILTRGCQAANIPLPEGALAAFRSYYEFLEEKNSVMNLTAISGETDVATLHFLDCLSLLSAADMSGSRIIDIGSGAGFPGLPLKIADSSIDLTMLDALKKRVQFLTELCTAVNTPCTCIHARAEEQSLIPGFRDSFDFALSRAVARLNLLCELCLPFVRPGGKFIAMKSIDTEDEITEAKSAIKTLGGKIEKVIDYNIPSTDIPRRVVIISKLTNTPKGYPRRFAKIQKAPL